MLLIVKISAKNAKMHVALGPTRPAGPHFNFGPGRALAKTKSGRAGLTSGPPGPPGFGFRASPITALKNSDRP